MIYDHSEQVKLIAGRYKIPVTLKYKGNRIYLFFGYNKELLAEVKCMQGAKWHGFDKTNPIKAWSIANSVRNHFAMSFLRGNNPYAGYQKPLDDTIRAIKSSLVRTLYDHQIEMCAHIIDRHYCIVACEMGTGKTLAAIEAAERCNIKSEELLYIGPKSGVFAVGREFNKWKSPLKPKMMTYEGLTKAATECDYPFIVGNVPRYVIFDESSKIKNPSAKRSQAALDLSELVKNTHMKDGYVILMSGTPAPRVPVDWYHQLEVACPGYVKEGDIHKFKKRLCVVEERESITGGVYPHIVTWRDDDKKCEVCGKYASEPEHNSMAAIAMGKQHHPFVPMKNEVSFLYQRMKGLVLVKFKKDCLDLPDKQYQTIKIKPSVEILRMAKMITRTATRAVTALSLLRELSDGFQYKEVPSGEKTCPACFGSGKIVDPGDPMDDSSNVQPVEVQCPACGGTGKVAQYMRGADRIKTPKDDALSELLEDHADIGRLVIWGGFTETIDKICDFCHQNGWSTIRVDGRGYRSHDVTGEIVQDGVFLDSLDASHPEYKSRLEKYPKVAFVGHPKAGGMALTLTASPTAIYYSNTFDGEARMQSEDRIHRAGMDVNRGCTIIDLVHLPSDQLVIDNLQKKKKLQNMTMGELSEAIGV
jgi:hypothetical protein